MAIFGAIVYGTTSVISKALADQDFTGPTVVAFRFGGTAALLFLMGLILKQPLVPARGEWVKSIGIGGGFAISSLLVFAALQRGDAGIVSLLTSLFPAWVVMIEFGFGHKPSKVAVLSVVMSLFGVGVIAVASMGGSTSLSSILLSLASSVGYAGALYASGRLVTDSEPLPKAAWIAVGVTIVCLIAGAATGELQNPLRSWQLMSANSIASAINYLCLFVALEKIGPTRSGVIINLYAPSAMFLAWVLLGEAVSGAQIVGAIIILVAVAILGMEDSTAIFFKLKDKVADVVAEKVAWKPLPLPGVDEESPE